MNPDQMPTPRERARSIVADLLVNHLPRIEEGLRKGYVDENQILVMYDHAVRARILEEHEKPVLSEHRVSSTAAGASSLNPPVPAQTLDTERLEYKLLTAIQEALTRFNEGDNDNGIQTLLSAVTSPPPSLLAQAAKDSGEKEAVDATAHVLQNTRQVEIVDTGHAYRLPSFDGQALQTLIFMKREGDGYSGNVGHYPGTNLQSVLRACLDRVIYLQGQIPHENNIAIVCHIKHCLRELEQRAAERHGYNVNAITLDLASFGAMCVVCGHVVCGHSVSDRGSSPAASASSPTPLGKQEASDQR